jgi:DNA invertase Pin-like site-specific DNA recombinase
VDGGAIIHAFDENRLSEIISPGGTFRNTSNDKMSMQIDLCMAKKYVDDLSDNVKRGNRTKLEKGWLPGRAPLGYLNDPIERTIVPDPERFHLVRNIWDLLLQGVLPDRIQRTARDEWQLRTRLSKKTGNNTISRSAIYRYPRQSVLLRAHPKEGRCFPREAQENDYRG